MCLLLFSLFPNRDRTLLIFSITIVKCQWFLYFDDYHEQGPVRSSIHSALWTYLHFMLNLSQLLLGVGCLDLIRVYQTTREGVPPPGPSHLQPSHFESGGHFPAEAAGAGGLPMPRSLEEVGGGSTGGMVEGGAAGGGHDTAQLVYVKKYYLIVAASVFFFNATIKYVTSRPKGKMRRGSKEKYTHPFSIKLTQYIVLSRQRKHGECLTIYCLLFFSCRQIRQSDLSIEIPYGVSYLVFADRGASILGPLFITRLGSRFLSPPR